MDEQQSVLQHALHRLLLGDEVRREVAVVELHPLDEVEGGLHRLGLFDGDRAVLADLVHGVRDDVPDLGVAVGGDRRDLHDLRAVLDLLRELPQLLDDRSDGAVDAALEVHRVGPGGDVAQSLAIDRLGENRRGRGAVAGHVAGLAGDLADHLGAHVLPGVFQGDLLGDRHAVLGDRRGAPLLVEHHVPPARSEGHLDRLGQDLDPLEDLLAGFRLEEQLLGWHLVKPP